MRSLPAAFCGILWWAGDRSLHDNAEETILVVTLCGSGLALLSITGIVLRRRDARMTMERPDLAHGLVILTLLSAAAGAVFAGIIGFAIEFVLRARGDALLAFRGGAWHALGAFCVITSPGRS